jgi:acetyltransferase-like isoleucine patch superfamily enzyme
MTFRLLVSLGSLMLPWPLRRLVLVHVLGYAIDKKARIGFSVVIPARLEMGPYALIGHLTFCKPGVELIRLGEGAIIGNLNWLGAVPLIDSPHFHDQKDRRPELIVDDYGAITNRHFFDCSDTVTIGRFSTFAGVRSVVLSHSIDLATSKQRAQPVSIGEYCFVGTAAVILPGTRLPSYSILGANSLLNKTYIEPYFLYAGTPARPIKQLSKDDKYFSRTTGFVD